MKHAVLLAVLTAAVSLDPAGAATYFVAPDGSGDFPTIQAAVDGVANGDTIELGSGLFQGPGNRGIRYRGRTLTVRARSGDPDCCLIDCELQTSGFIFDGGEISLAVLDGVTVMQGNGDLGGGIVFLDYSSPTIRHCVFTANTSDFFGGGLYSYASFPTLVDCVFEDCTARLGGGLCIAEGAPTLTGCTIAGNTGEWGGGLDCYGAAPIFTACTIADNFASVGGGAVYCEGGASAQLENCIIAFNDRTGAVVCSGYGSSATLACCDLYGNVGGDWIGCIASQYGTDGNICADPRFCGEVGLPGPYSLRDDSPCAAENNPGCGQIGAWSVGCGVMVVRDPYAERRSTHLDAGWRAARLSPVHPNPTTGATTIAYRLLMPGPGGVSLSIFDPQGRCVRTLVQESAVAGEHVFPWNGADGAGQAVPSGLYVIRLSANGSCDRGSVLVVR